MSNRREQIAHVWRLSIPAILTQITSIAMQYIDSAMVGKLGAGASAAIGLVSTSTWLIGGLGSIMSVGFSVQVAQHIGANNHFEARRVVKHGLVTTLLFALLLLGIGVAISLPLPRWLGGEEAIQKDATAYFFVFACSIPFMEINRITSAFLQCSGNMVTPSALNAAMCGLDVVFNALLIPRFGVLGASLGTGAATAVIALLMLWRCLRAPVFRSERKEPCPFDGGILKRAMKIGLPVGAEQAAMCGAMVATTMILAPLGTVAIAANSFAITAEGLCYMPAYGIAAAATAIVGQQVGAGNAKEAKQLGSITIGLGCITMVATALVMFFGCPFVFRLLTPDVQVQQLATQVLRIGLLAEPLYGVSIVASGALRGAEDTLVPSLLNLGSIWIVRIGSAVLLVDRFGLHGAWMAMAIELCVRGALLLIRHCRSKYMVRA